jgi:hypothetical protein
MTTILKVLAGSRAYGLDRPDSDFDVIEIYVESAAEVLRPGPGRMKSQHVKNAEGDVQRHPLRHFLHLATSGNPAALEVFYAPVIEDTELGQRLRRHARSCVSLEMIPRYRGYIRAQTERLLGLRGQLRVTREHLRNAHGYDSKYAAHTLRLGYQCMEILNTGGLVLPMRPEDERRIMLRAVLAGRVPFEDWWNRVIALDAAIKAASRTTTVPKEPDRAGMNEFSVWAHMRTWISVSVDDQCVIP